MFAAAFLVKAPAFPVHGWGTALGYNDQDIAHKFGELTKINIGGSRRDAIKRLAQELGMPTKAVYDALERAKT